MKKIIYGPTGCGKSYQYIASLLDKENVIYVTANTLKDEFSYMNINDETGKMLGHYYELGSLSIQEREQYIMTEMADFLELKGYTNNPDNVIILSGFYEAINDRRFIRRITKWESSVIIEYTCKIEDAVNNTELKDIMRLDEWEKIIVMRKQ